MSSYKQLLKPNLDPVVYEEGKILLDWYGWCLATVETAFGTPRKFKTAWLAWEATTHKHEDRDLPVGVYVPIWFSGAGGDGHVAFAFVNANGSMGIWTAPFEHTPYFYTGYHSVDDLARGYHVTYVGWSEDIGGTPVIEAVPDAVPVVAAPAPAPKPATSNIIYTKLKNPQNLVTNKQPTNCWNLGFEDYPHATAASALDKGASFVAYGKAQRTDLDKPCYYMTEADFGDADATGTPVQNVGINTVDLSAAPADAAAEVVPVASSATLASASAPMTTVTPVAPPKPPMPKTTKNVADYEAIEDYQVVDLLTNTPAAALLKGQTVHSVVRFDWKDESGDTVEYVMTQKSVDAGKLNGVPVAVLKLVQSIDIDSEDDSLLDDLKLDEFIEDTKKIADNIIDRVKQDTSLREKIVDFVARVVFRSKKQTQE